MKVDSLIQLQARAGRPQAKLVEKAPSVVTPARRRRHAPQERDRFVATDSLLQRLADWLGSVPDSGEIVSMDGWNALVGFYRSADIGASLPALLFDPAWYAAKHDLRTEGREAGEAALLHYFKTGSALGDDPTPWFSEKFYLRTYPDVREAISAKRWRCGYQHYLLHGITEHRSPSAAFNELAYIGSYPDVLDGIRVGMLPNGFLHYALLGEIEGRTAGLKPPSPLLTLPLTDEHVSIAASSMFAETLYCAANGDVGQDGRQAPGMQHWLNHGLEEDLAGTRQRIRGWVDAVYMRENPDLEPFIGPDGQPNGYAHFLMYGWTEGRRWAGDIWAQRERAHLERAMTTRSQLTELTTGGSLETLALIAVVVPVYNPVPAVLRACINSVRAQTYPKWQLTLTDDGSNAPEVVETLVNAERSDSRISVIFSTRNGGISAASNLAIANSEGEFIALLDHDDLLAPDALLHVARAFGSKPDVDIVYTDEGKVSENGELFLLNPKPDWSPELLLSTMYIGHLTAYRRSLVERLGGFRSTFDGTQDYDLALRASEVARCVVHVPLPLYMWRMSSTSTAGSINAKPGVLALQKRALESALLRRQLLGRVEPGHGQGHWRVLLDVARTEPLVSIVIPTAGRAATIGGRTIDLLVNCVRSLETFETYQNYEIVVVHNGDLRAETMQGLESVRRLRLLHYKSARFNLSEKINFGVKAAAGSYVLLLNDDMQAASDGLIQSMLGRMFDGVGIIGGRLLYANGALQHAGIIWTAEGPTHAMIGEHRMTPGPAERLQVMHDCFGVSGACMFFRRGVYLDLGGFSPSLPTNYNDVELCLRARQAGLRVVFNPDVTLYHFESVSKAGTYFWELQLLILAHPRLNDPYMNPTFSRRSPFYELVDLAAPARPSYRAWMVSRIDNRRPLRHAEASIRFSFILSVYETPAVFLEELEATLVHQTYRNWELVLVDNGCRAAETVAWIERVRSLPNVTFIRLDVNKGIMGGYGTAFRAAAGDYVVPIDSDDLLMLDCLDVLASFLIAEDMPDALYSDEDKADPRSNTHSPFLKPDWDPVLFMNMCYVAHVCAIRRTLAAKVGAYSDDAASGCHDWDSFLRLSRAGARIMHVPEVLYSWRIHPGSTASIETGNKPYTITSQKHVLDQHLTLTGMDEAFEVVQNELFPHNGMWRLKPLELGQPHSAVLLLAAVEPGRTARVLEDLAMTSLPAGCRLIVVGDDDAQRELKQLLPEFKRALWPRNGEPVVMGLTAAASLCAEESRLVALLDAGVARPSGDWLREGTGIFAAAADVGAVCGQISLPDGRMAWRGGFAGFGGMAGSPDYGRSTSDSGYFGTGWCQRTCDSVPAACFFARPELLKEALTVLGDEPTATRILSGQVSLAVQRAGMRIVYTPFVHVLLTHDVLVDPILPRTQAKAKAAGPDYYPAAFGTTLNTAWQLMGADEMPTVAT